MHPPRNPRRRSLLKVLWHRKSVVLLLMALVTTAVAVVSHFTPQLYRAKAAVLVKLGREFIYRPQFGGDRSASMFRLNEMINTEISLLESQDLATTVVRLLGPTTLYPNLAEGDGGQIEARAVGKFRESLSVTAVTESSVIEVAYQHRSASLAAQAVNTLVEEFEGKHLQVFGESRPSFLEADTETLGEQLQAAVTAHVGYRTEHKLWNPDEQERQLLTQRGELATRLGEANAGLTGRERRRALEDAQSQLLRSQFAEQELLARYRPDSRAVKAARAEIDVARRLLEELEQQEAQRVAEQVAALQAEIARIDAEMVRVAEGRRRLRELERDEQRLEAQHSKAVQRLADARDATRLDKEGSISVRLIDTATPPMEPQGLSPLKRVLLGAAVGLLFAIATVLAWHLLAEPARPRPKPTAPRGRPSSRRARAMGVPRTR